MVGRKELKGGKHQEKINGNINETSSLPVIYRHLANKINLGKHEAVMQNAASFSMIRIHSQG